MITNLPRKRPDRRNIKHLVLISYIKVLFERLLHIREVPMDHEMRLKDRLVYYNHISKVKLKWHNNTYKPWAP